MSVNFQRSAKQLMHFASAGEDVVLIVLKGHLLVEERLNEILTDYIPYPNDLSGANLRYFHIAHFCKSLFYMSQDDWIWEAIFSLNALRNDLAHKLESKKREQLIENFLLPLETTYQRLGHEPDSGSVSSRLIGKLCFLLGVLENYPPAKSSG